MKKLKQSGTKYSFVCPGCKLTHLIETKETAKRNWSFSGDIENPTFEGVVTINLKLPKRKCAFTIKSGKISFSSDSFHKSKGLTVDMTAIKGN